MKNQKSGIEIVNETLEELNSIKLEIIRNLKEARENDGHIKIICFWPENFVPISFNDDGTPTWVKLHDAINITHTIRNDKGEPPMIKSQNSFYELKLNWICDKIDATRSLLD